MQKLLLILAKAEFNYNNNRGNNSKYDAISC